MWNTHFNIEISSTSNKFESGTEWGGLKRETVEIKAILWLDFHKTKFTFSFFTNWMSFQNIPEPTFFVIFYVN